MKQTGNNFSGGGRFKSIYCSVPEAAVLLGISYSLMAGLLDQGEIDYIRPSKHRRVKRADVLDYRELHRVGAGATPVEELSYDHLD
jgi:excisionase family DNA binding protein